jgi:hypothetical protein
VSDPQFVVIEQRIQAGNDWDGTVPTSTPDFSTKGVKRYPAAVAGGKFAFDFTAFFLMEIQQIAVNFNGVGSKSIVIRGPGGAADDIEIFKSSDPLEVNILITDKFQLAPDENLVILSTGAANAMFARVIGRPLHPEPATML